MAAVTICSDFGAKKIKSLTVSTISPSICHEVIGLDAMILAFCMLSFKQLFHSPLSLSSRGFLFLFTFCHKGGITCLSEVIYISPTNLDSSLWSSSPAFLMMYSAYKLNKQCDNIQPWRTPLLIWNRSVVPCPVLTVASWSAYRFLRRQIRWSGIPISKNFPQFVMIHTVKGFGTVKKAEVDVFLELLLFRWSSGYWQLDLWFLCLF